MNPKKGPVAIGVAKGALNNPESCRQFAHHWLFRQLSCDVLDAGLSRVRSVEQVVAGYAAQARLILAELSRLAPRCQFYTS